jgi:hypothetical protein
MEQCAVLALEEGPTDLPTLAVWLAQNVKTVVV